MSNRTVREDVNRFAGLNDRDLPAQISQFECADLLNAELGDGVFARRNGYSRVTSTPFLDTAVRLNGIDEYFRIPHDTGYQPSGSDRFFISVDCIFRTAFNFDSGAVTSGDRTLIHKGYGGDASTNEFRLFYDVSVDSNTGGWTMNVRDAAAGGSLKSWSVADAFEDAVGLYRHIEFGWFDTGYELRVYSSAGTLLGSDTTADITTWNATSHPIFIGVAASASDTPETSKYAMVTIAELRLAIFSSSTYANGCPISQEIATGGVTNPPRELNPRLGEEGSFLKGYWKFNDGDGNIAADRGSEEHDAEMAAAGPTWTVNSTYVLGAAGVRYFGEQGHIHVSWDQSDVDELFNPGTSGTPQNTQLLGFHIDMLYVPLLRDAAIQDGTIFWTGTNATNPSPIGIRIVSGVLTFYFFEGGSTLRTISGVTSNPGPLGPSPAALSLAAKVGKRIRISTQVWFNGGTSTYIFRASVFVEGDSYGYVGTYAGSTSGLFSNPSTEWSFGRHLTSFLYPYAFTANSSIYGVLDDIRVVSNTSSALTAGNLFGPFTPLTSQFAPAAPNLLGYLKLDEGEGNSLINSGTGGTTSFLYPETSEGVEWDHGLVEPYVPAEIRGGVDFRRFTQNIAGSPERSVLICAGAGLYRVNMASGVVEPVGGGVRKGGLVTTTAYNNEVIISARNSRRPVIWDGSSTYKAGIEAGVSKISTVTSSTAGSLVDGTYYLYYTYVDSQGRESNPGPGFQITLSGGNNGRVTGLKLPVSRDPQVASRRVYMTGVNAADGAAAFLIHEQNDNNTVTVGSLTVNTAPTTSPLEYFDNGPAPAGGTVRVFNDRLFIGGGSKNPTRVYFSKPVTLTQFDHVDDYVNLDSDAGDPVINLTPRNNVLAAYTRDRRADLWTTGLSVDPVDWAWANSSVGCVSPQGVVETGRGHIFLGERSVILTDGYNDRSLSAPARKPAGEPNSSIQNLLRKDLNTARLEYASIAFHRTRDQLYIALPSSASKDSNSLLNGRNDIVAIVDLSRMTWTKHSHRAEILMEIEDENDQSWIYGGIQGHLCRLDDPDQNVTDGLAAAQGGLASGNSSDGTSLIDASGFSGDLKGYDFWFYDVSANTITSRVISHNTTGVVYFYDALGVTPVTNDLWAVGIYPFYGDFVFGNQLQARKKRPRWLKVAARSSANDNNLQVVVSPEMLSGTPNWTTRTTLAREIDLQVGSADTFIRFPLPYFATSWRIRVSDTLLTEAMVALTSRPADAVPGNHKTEIFEIGVEYDLTGAR